MAWQQLRFSAASADADWPLLGTLPDDSICDVVGDVEKARPQRGLKFCLLWTDSAGNVVLGAGSATATLVEVLDSLPDATGGERAFAGQSLAITAHSLYSFDGLSRGKFTIRITAPMPAGSATHFRILWGTY